MSSSFVFNYGLTPTLIPTGHAVLDCKNPRKGLFEGVEEISAEQAWEEMKVASDERDLDDFKEALEKYLKAVPDSTYVQLEGAFRGQNFNVFLIAVEKELTSTYTNMDIQGNLGKTFTISYRLSAHHQRPKEKEMWPPSPEENLVRLADAGKYHPPMLSHNPNRFLGVPVDRGVPKCSNCEELGHTKKHCPEEQVENVDRAVVKCYNVSWCPLNLLASI